MTLTEIETIWNGSGNAGDPVPAPNSSGTGCTSMTRWQLGELDDPGADPSPSAEAVDQLRGRIEILMDEIDTSLGIEPRRSPATPNLR